VNKILKMTTTNNKCKKCGCDDSFMPSPAPCPTPIGCPTPQPCSEVFDAQCVVYTGVDIECGEVTVVNTNDTVAEALENVVDYFCSTINDLPCPISVSIDPTQLPDTLQANAVGGTGAYTYQWSIAQNAFAGYEITGSNTNYAQVFTLLSDNYLMGNGPKYIYQAHVKVKVTDENGCSAYGYYLLTKVVTP
jgi:hypothetical protein